MHGRANSTAASTGAADTGSASDCVIALAGEEFLADCSGALWHAGERALLLADLHLEKGSSYAARGQFLPPYDTAATLARIARLLVRYDPRCIIALGDSFHDRRAGERLQDGDRAALGACMKARDWIWIAGNHDPDLPGGLGDNVESFALGHVVCRHEPLADGTRDDARAPAEIAGHLHPVARVVSAGGSVRRRCFISDARRCILPAFGAYTGGLNIRESVFSALFPADRSVHVLGRSRVYNINPGACV